jgi:hypothetical protein
MSDVSLFIAAGVIYYLCAFSPVVCSGYVVLRRSPLFPRRFLFVATVTVLSYGVLNLAGYLINIPVAAYLVYVAPQLEANGQYAGQPFTSFGSAAVRYWLVWSCPVLLVTSILTTRYLSKRWHRIAEALGG